MTLIKQVPNLRFPNYDEPYRTNVFEDIFVFSSGKNIKQNEASPDFETPCVRYGELYHMYDEVINEVINRTNIDKSELIFSEGDEILLPSAGEDPKDIASASALLVKDVAIGRTINVLKPKKQNVYSNAFVSYYINQKLKRKIASLAKGVSISNVYNSDLKNLEISLPTLNEQQKIASFLSSVDKKIELLKQKKDLLEDYKKGVMQQVFSQQLRFKDDDGNDYPDWDVMNFDDVFQSISTKKHQIKSSEILEIGKNRVIDQGQNQIAGYSNEDAKLMSKLPVVIFGDHTTIIKYVNFPFIIGADGTKILKTKTNSDLKYLYYFIKHNNVEQQGYRRHFSLLRNLIIEIPCDEEQTKISKFLSSIDNKIELVKNQIDNTENFKKGLLQQMFVE